MSFGNLFFTFSSHLDRENTIIITVAVIGDAVQICPNRDFDIAFAEDKGIQVAWFITNTGIDQLLLDGAVEIRPRHSGLKDPLLPRTIAIPAKYRQILNPKGQKAVIERIDMISVMEIIAITFIDNLFQAHHRRLGAIAKNRFDLLNPATDRVEIKFCRRAIKATAIQNVKTTTTMIDPAATSIRDIFIIPNQDVIAMIAIETISPGPAIELVFLVAAIQIIPTAAAIEYVFAIPAIEVIIPPYLGI